MRGGIVGQQTGGEHAVEAADVAGELGEAEVDQAMQLADPVAEILPQPVAMADELAQALGGLVVQPGWCGALLECAERARPVASIASVLVRSRLLVLEAARDAAG